MTDAQSIVGRLAALERWQANSRRWGTVVQVEAGKVRVRFDKQRAGSQSPGKPFLSPWIPTGDQHGFTTQTASYEIGQQVLVESLNDDFTQSVILPYAPSEHNPQDKDAKVNRNTRRIRKPREKTDVSTEETPTFEKKEDDDENDLIMREDYNGRYVKKGKLEHVVGKPMTEDGKPSDKPEQFSFTIGKSSFHMEDGKIVFKVDEAEYEMTAQGIKEKVKEHEREMTGSGTDFKKGAIKHDNTKIDASHRHSGVRTGDGNTDPPVS